MIPLTNEKSIESDVYKSFNHISEKIDKINVQTSPIVYHGTFAEFEKFDKSKLGSHTGSASAFEGFFFASNKEVAISYASSLNQKLERLAEKEVEARKKIEDLTGDNYMTAVFKAYREKYDKETVNKIYELYKDIEASEDFQNSVEYLPMAFDSELGEGAFLKIARLYYKNPLIHDMNGEEYRDISYKELMIQAKNNGNDAVIIKNTYDGMNPVASLELTDIYVVFDESQIEELNNDDNDEGY